MLQQIQVKWRNWREKRRQYQIERAVYMAGREHASADQESEAARHHAADPPSP